MLVTKTRPFWWVVPAKSVIIDCPSIYPNHTLCGLSDFTHLYALDHARQEWVSPLSSTDCWAYRPIVNWMCYPGSEPYDRIMAAAMAVQMGAPRSALRDTLAGLCRQVHA